MPDRVRVPVKTIGTERWGQLCLLAEQHFICAEKVKLKDDNFSFAGQHRVRLYSFKKNVNWKIPEGIALDIAEVAPARRPQNL
jgi:hypothetical protein